jgi:hypothetical protein
MNNELEDDSLSLLIDNVEIYEDSIRQIYLELFSYLPEIEWLKEKRY